MLGERQITLRNLFLRTLTKNMTIATKSQKYDKKKFMDKEKEIMLSDHKII